MQWVISSLEQFGPVSHFEDIFKNWNSDTDTVMSTFWLKRSTICLVCLLQSFPKISCDLHLYPEHVICTVAILHWQETLFHKHARHMQLHTLHYSHNSLASSWNCTSSVESCDACVLATPSATRLPFSKPKFLPVIRLKRLRRNLHDRAHFLLNVWSRVGLRSFVGFLTFDPHCFQAMFKRLWQTTSAKALTSPACSTQSLSALMNDSCCLFVKLLLGDIMHTGASEDEFVTDTKEG